MVMLDSGKIIQAGCQKNVKQACLGGFVPAEQLNALNQATMTMLLSCFMSLTAKDIWVTYNQAGTSSE